MPAPTNEKTPISPADSCASINARWFFAWRMAAACEDALREAQAALATQRDPRRAQALKEVTSLLHKELQSWIRRGEALDMIVDRLPRADR
jgi:hypothetical protein